MPASFEDAISCCCTFQRSTEGAARHIVALIRSHHPDFAEEPAYYRERFEMMLGRRRSLEALNAAGARFSDGEWREVLRLAVEMLAAVDAPEHADEAL
jgi:hypothetical protein